MASRQTVGGDCRRTGSDLRGYDIHVSAASNRLHRSNTRTETPEMRHGVRTEFAENTLGRGDASELSPIGVNLRVGVASGSSERRDGEQDRMEIEAPPSTHANNASDDTSETMMKDAVESLLSLNQSHPSAFHRVVGCTLRNIQYIYLTQQSIFKLMHLETTMRSNGWDMSMAGVQLLKGVVVMVGHKDGWKLRRIHSCVHDAYPVADIIDRALDDDDAIQEYVIDELNYQIETLKLNPIGLYQLAEIYARLSLCGSALKKIQRGDDQHHVLQELAQELLNRPIPSFLERFKAFVDPMSVVGRSRASELYMMRLNFVRCHLPSIWQSWLGHCRDEDMTLEDALIHNADAAPVSMPPMRFQHSAAAAIDPRRASRLHVIHTDDASIPNRAPRRWMPSRVIDHRIPSTNRSRMRSLNTVHRECMIRSELQSNTAYESLTDAERALRRVRRSYEHDGSISDT